MYPPTDEISTTILSKTLVTGIQVNYKNKSVFNLDHTYKHTNSMIMVWGP